MAKLGFCFLCKDNIIKNTLWEFFFKNNYELDNKIIFYLPSISYETTTNLKGFYKFLFLKNQRILEVFLIFLIHMEENPN